MAPILPVPGMALTAEMNDEISGFETRSRCLTNHGGSITPIVPVDFVLLIDYTLLLTELERRLDGLQELNRQATPLVDIGDIAGEASLSVVIGQEADVLEFMFMAEDWWLWLYRMGGGVGYVSYSLRGR
jgi:hypothetical protein